MDAHLLLSVHPSAVGLMAVDFMKRKQTAAAEWGAKKKKPGANGSCGTGRESGGFTWKQLTIKESAGEIEASHAQSWRDSDGHDDDC